MRAPAVLPAIALLAGAAAGIHLHPDPTPVRAALLAACTVACIAFVVGAGGAAVVALALGFACGGCALGTIADREATRSSLREMFEREIAPTAARSEPHEVIARVRQDAARTPFGAAMNLAIEQIRHGGTWYRVAGGVRTSVSGSRAAHVFHEWSAGRVLRIHMSLRRPPRYRNSGITDQDLAAARHGTALLGAVKSAGLVHVEERASLPQEMAARIRRDVAARLDASVGRWATQSAAVAVAIAIGSRTSIDMDVERRLQAAGTFHVIAISGGNVAVFTSLCVFVLRVIGVSGRVAAVCAIVVILAYGFVVQGSASVARAVMVACTYLAARAVDHRTSPLNALAVAAAFTLVLSPLSLTDAGFALSFGATAGIILGFSRMRRSWIHVKWSSRYRATVWTRMTYTGAMVAAATVWAEAALLPVGAYVFSRITVAGIVLNLIAVPLMGVVQVASLFAIAAAVLLPELARAGGWIAHAAVQSIVSSAGLVEWLPGLEVRVPPPPSWLIGAYYLALGIALVSLRRRTVMCALTGASACAAAMWLGVPVVPREPSADVGLGPAVQVLFLDVAQGDATLVRADGMSAIVDAGAAMGRFDVGERVVSPAVWDTGVRRLDLMVVSHGDPDHAGGAVAVQHDFNPVETWEGVPVPGHELLRTLKDAIRRDRRLWRSPQLGEVRALGPASVVVHHPPVPDWERQNVRNDDSIVLELRIGSVAILLPGDIGHAVEQQLLPRFDRDRQWIVKMAHHGSRTSSSAQLIEHLRPLAAIASAGTANPYGHPASEVLRRYESAGTMVFRTDRDGAVTLWTDGGTIWMEAMSGKRLVFRRD